MKIEIPEYLITEKYINKTKHPIEDLYIYNYAPKTQFEKFWNEYTLICRGLVLDGDNNVIARPFPKFFNMEELQGLDYKIPNESFEVTMKMDGSLLIVFHYRDKWFTATRGSFVSEQAIKGKNILYGKYGMVLPDLPYHCTYLFEVIYPENKIVCDYGKMEDIILLGLINKDTGEEYHLKNLGFPMVKMYNGITDYKTLKTLENENEEGFVIKFIPSNFRMKIKFEEYKRLHRILTNTSSLSIWDCLKNNNPIEQLLDNVPDEFYNWVKDVANELKGKYDNIEKYLNDNFKILPTRKETAIYFMTLKNPTIFFAKLDGYDYSQIIWKLLRPTFQKPFRDDIDVNYN